MKTPETKGAFCLVLRVPGPSAGAPGALSAAVPTATLRVCYYVASIFEMRKPRLKNGKTLGQRWDLNLR